MARESHTTWLHEQLAVWRSEGVVDAATAERIAARHPLEADRPGVPLLLFLGAALFGIGLIWLVAANLEIEEIGPLQRVLGVAAIWLALVAAAEVLEPRARWRPTVAPLRLIAALAYGGTIFQAAQSLQVPAYEPDLLVAWGAGSLAYAHAVRARGPLVIGIAVLTGAGVWMLAETGGDATALILGLGLACPVAAAMAALQSDDFGGPWRFVAAAAGLVALGVASVPEAAGDEWPSGAGIGVGAFLAAVSAAVAAVREPAERRVVLGAAAVALAALLLVAIAPSDSLDYGSDGEVTGGQTAYTLLACALFLLAAVGVALSGETNLAYAALLLFVAVQSFGLLATLVSGAVLVLSVGVLLIVAGIVLDRGRRRLLEETG